MSGATVMSDQFPSQTAVSLYFTPTGSQGVGVITGSATAATVVSTTSSGSGGSSSGGAGAKTTSGTSGTTSKASAASGSKGSSQSSSTSSAGVAPTGVWFGVVGAVAGGAIVAVL